MKGEEVGVAARGGREGKGLLRTNPWDSRPVGVYLDPGLGPCSPVE